MVAPVQRCLRFVGWLFLLLSAWCIGVGAWIIWIGSRDQAQAVDVIIVLGAAAYDARPSPVFEERIRHAIDLYRRGYAPLILFTGGFGVGARFSESQVARRYALRQGVPDHAILIETVSHNTQQNLQQAHRLMQKHHLHRALMVSDPLHMARALRIGQQIGIDAFTSATPSTRFRSIHTSWRFLLQEIYFFHRDLITARVAW